MPLLYLCIGLSCAILRKSLTVWRKPVFTAENAEIAAWEWTRSLWGRDVQRPDFLYPYQAADGREDLAAGESVLRILRNDNWFARCASRLALPPSYRDTFIGFRLALTPS